MHFSISNIEITATAAIAAVSTGVPEKYSTGSSTHIATIAVSILVFISSPKSNAAESALSAHKIIYCGINVSPRKIRPKYIRKIKLRICGLPKKKV